MWKQIQYSDGNHTYGEEIVPMTPEEAKNWAEEKLDVDLYETIFGEVDE